MAYRFDDDQNDDQVAYLLRRETDEREAARNAKSEASRDIHLLMAERLADEAWSVMEAIPGGGYVPSTLWTGTAMGQRTAR